MTDQHLSIVLLPLIPWKIQNSRQKFGHFYLHFTMLSFEKKSLLKAFVCIFFVCENLIHSFLTLLSVFCIYLFIVEC